MAGRVTQEAVEAVVTGASSSTRLTQEAVEAAVTGANSNSRVTQEAVEAVVTNASSNTRVTQEAVEVVITELPTIPAPSGTSSRGLPYDSVTPDPVDTLTGAYQYSHTDVAIAGRGPSPTFRRSYSSVDTRFTAEMGQGWTHNYAINLASPGDGTLDVILMGPDGRSDRYVHNADGSYTAPPAVYTTLAKNADNSYTATLTNQTTWTFRADGRLTAIKDRYGNQSSLTYNSAGQLTSVSDPASRGSLTFTYSTPGSQLLSVSDWLSPARTIKFTYDASNRLQSVIDRNGYPTVYAYDGTSSRLTTITDANGHLTRTNHIRATHFTEMRTAIQDLWTAASLGTLPNWTVGSAPSSSRQVSARDINDLRSWFNTYQSGHTWTDNPATTTTRVRATHLDELRSAINAARAAAGLAPFAWSDNPPAVTNTYDAQGRVSTQKDALGFSSGQATTFSYVTNGDGTKTTTITYPSTSLEPGFHPTVAETYDTSGRITTRVTKPSSTETYTESYTYDSNFNRTSVTDARGNTTNFCYDVDYTGATISTSHGNLTRRIDPPPTTGANRPVTLFKYDTKNNLIEMIPPRGVSSGTAVTCSTNLSTLINANYATDYTYDSSTQTQLLSVTRKFTDPDLGLQTATIKYEYGDSSNPGLATRIIPPRGNIGGTPDYTYATTVAYNASGSQAGLLQSSTDADGNQTTYTYDAVGRRLTMVDPNGNATGGTPADHTWSYTYDAEDRLLTQVAPAPTHGGTALTTTFQYDAMGNRTAVTDANGQVTVYIYDVRDQLTEVHQSSNSWTNAAVAPSPLYASQYVYDNLGNLTRMIRAANDPTANRATDYLYDGSRRLRQEVQYPSWPLTTSTLTTTYAYDGNGNRTSLIDPLSQTTTFTFDALNRLTGMSYSDGVTPNVTYSYDANGNRSTMVDGTGTTSYAYDEMDRLQSVTSPGSSVVAYRYDLDGNRTKLIYPDSTAVTYSFDKASRLASLSDWASRGTSYTYVPDGHVQQLTNVNGTVTQYSYDNAQRLTQVLNKQSGGTTIDQHSYTLDSVGTRTQVAETLAQIGGNPITPTTSYSYDKLYELTADGATAYTYDPVGNRLTMASTSYSYDKADRIAAAGSTSYTVNANGNVTARGSDSFGYDQANRLKSATVSGTTTTNTFNGDGKRASQKVGAGATVTYHYDTNRSLPVVLSDGTLKYVWGLGLLYAVDGSANLQVYHADGLGSVRALTDGTATLIDTYRTDAWGNPTAAQGSSTQPFRFAGEQLDADGLLYLRARFYEPGSGRFVSRDRLVGIYDSPVSLNRFGYAANNPISRNDPSGLKSFALLDLADIPGLDIPSDLVTPIGRELTLDLLRRNVSLAEGWRDYPNYIKYWIFLTYVAPTRPWDYKFQHRQAAAAWDAFGNFNYGATGTAAGIAEETLLRGAGFAQIPGDAILRLTGKTPIGVGSPLGGPPYGDDPQGQHEIKAGIDYYKAFHDAIGPVT